MNAATNVLVTRGLQGFNTNAVAVAAGINVATLYHYFPDKVSILAELFVRDQNKRKQYITKQMDEFAHVSDLERWTRDLVHAIVELRRANPETAVLRQACRTVPEIVTLEHADSDQLIAHFAHVLQVRFAQLGAARARNCSRTIVETGAALLDRATLEDDHARGLINETVAMLVAYLSSLAD